MRDADDDARPTIPRGQTARARRAGLLFNKAIHGTHRGVCRFTYGGVVPASGVPRVRTSCIGQRFEDWQRCCYRHWTGARLLKSDRVVAVCATGALCGDKRHLHVIPAPKLPKTLRLSPAEVAADTAAAIAFGGAAITLPPPPSITLAGP